MPDYLRENLHPDEDKFFKANPKTTGMATKDGKVILNPYSKLNEVQRQSVYLNEKTRLQMRKYNYRPKFQITAEQEVAFKGYGSEQDIRETIAARIRANDPSAGKATKDQLKFVDRFRLFMND